MAAHSSKVFGSYKCMLSIFGGKAQFTKNICSSRTRNLCSNATNEICNGANIYKDGKDPNLKLDTEYPDWLWTLRPEKATLDELQMTDNIYWRKIRKSKNKEQNALRKQGKLR